MSSEIDPEVKAILAKRYPSYHEPFGRARAWNREGLTESLKKGEDLARGLKKLYPHILQVRYELAFSLLQQKHPDKATAELMEAAQEFPVLDEDCWSLLGRCHKEEGDKLLEQGFVDQAEREYREAEKYYQKAYELRQDRFPGINVADLRLIRASLLQTMAQKQPEQADELRKQAAALLDQAMALARTLLRNTESNHDRIPDNDIWGWATEAGAHLILQQWDEAAQSYRRSLSQPNIPAQNRISMKTQVHRLLAAFARLGIVPKGPLTNPDEFFAVKK